MTWNDSDSLVRKFASYKPSNYLETLLVHVAKEQVALDCVEECPVTEIQVEHIWMGKLKLSEMK